MLLADRYRLDELVGRGGMGEVWRAEDKVLRRSVAVKLLLPHRADETAAERFRREAQAAARLSHPNVVAVYDFGTHEDSLFLVMELVDGRTLTQELAERGPLPPAEAVAGIAQAAAGLAAAHGQGLVHRDIKPGNLLLMADGTVKVADFGIARFISETETELTGAGQLVGTTYYLAPERAKGDPAGPESDIYSLGCVLYQLVTGRPPFDADSPVAVLYHHLDVAPVPPAELRPELAGPFQDALLQMLAKDPAARPTAAQVAAWSFGDLPSWSRPAALAVPEATPTVPEATPAVTIAAVGIDKTRTRMIQTAVAAAGVAAVTTAVVVALALGTDADKPPITEPSVGSTDPAVTRTGGPGVGQTSSPPDGDPGQPTGQRTGRVLSTQAIVGEQTTSPNATGSSGPVPTGSGTAAPNPTGPGTTGPGGPGTGTSTDPGPTGDTPAPTQPSDSTPGTSSSPTTTSEPPTEPPETTTTPVKPRKTKTKTPKP